jgi:hypothetical protein
MSDTLNNTEILELARLGKAIQMDLECDLNETGIPCRSCRFELIENMKQYLKLHELEVANG